MPYRVSSALISDFEVKDITLYAQSVEGGGGGGGVRLAVWVNQEVLFVTIASISLA